MRSARQITYKASLFFVFVAVLLATQKWKEIRMMQASEISRDWVTPVTNITDMEQTPTRPNVHQSYNDLHKADTAILDLVEWEELSLRGLDQPDEEATGSSTDPVIKAEHSCRPPPGISKTCCLGTFSTGGNVNPKTRHHCSKAFWGKENQWQQLQQLVRSFYESNLILQTNNNSKTVQCDICQIVELARIHNLNITLLGDSMHSQVFDGLLCELQRRQYDIETRAIDRKLNTSTYQSMRYRTILQVQSPIWKLINASRNTPVQITYDMLYLLPVKVPSVSIMEDMLANTQVLFLGMGLHWKYGQAPPGTHSGMKREAYGPAIKSFYKQVFSSTTSRVQLLVHRETSAQHFDIPGGDWFDYKEHAHKRQRQCVAYTAGASTYWREKAIRNVSMTDEYELVDVSNSQVMDSPANAKEVVSIPYHNFTEQFHRMHPTLGLDCTHYCGSPYMYYPLWRSFRRAMDRKYLQRNEEWFY